MSSLFDILFNIWYNRLIKLEVFFPATYSRNVSTGTVYALAARLEFLDVGNQLHSAAARAIAAKQQWKEWISSRL